MTKYDYVVYDKKGKLLGFTNKFLDRKVTNTIYLNNKPVKVSGEQIGRIDRFSLMAITKIRRGDK